MVAIRNLKLSSIILVLIFPVLLLSACSGTREQLEGRTDKPAAPDDDFRSDTPAIIATTGRPQLIELYADW